MKPYHEDDRVTVYHGDCREVMAAMPEGGVDAIVTDPPYDLTSIVRRFGKDDAAPAKPEGMGGAYARLTKGFMGQTWDGTGVAFRPETWAAALRVLRPGGHLLAFGGTRTSHRMVCAIEDAGFEVRDTLAYMYGSGFPKSLNLHGDHEGWGTALKPAYEPIVLARKPLAAGSVAANVLAHGTGALNVDGCRIHTEGSEGKPYTVTRLKPGAELNKTGGNWRPEAGGVEYVGATKDGRWPANVVLSHSPECREVGTRRVRTAYSQPIRTPGHGTVYGGGQGYASGNRETGQAVGYADSDGYETVTAWACAPDCAVALLDTQAGPQRSGGTPPRRFADKTRNTWGTFNGEENPNGIGASAGNVSRFFYTAKASPSERQGVTHPTVKPVALMRWCCRLVTPTGGVVLDCFAGSGTTRLAALAEGFRCVLIEQNADYLEQLCGRAAQQGLPLDTDAAG